MKEEKITMLFNEHSNVLENIRLLNEGGSLPFLEVNFYSGAMETKKIIVDKDLKENIESFLKEYFKLKKESIYKQLKENLAND